MAVKIKYKVENNSKSIVVLRIGNEQTISIAPKKETFVKAFAKEKLIYPKSLLKITKVIDEVETKVDEVETKVKKGRPGRPKKNVQIETTEEKK